MADDYGSKKVEQEETKYAAHDIPSVHEAPIGVLEQGSLDPVYEAKATVLNKAIQDIGMGRYQWQVSTPTLTTALGGETTYLSVSSRIQSRPSRYGSNFKASAVTILSVTDQYTALHCCRIRLGDG